MLEKLKEILSTFSFLGINEVAKLIEICSIRSFKAGEVVVHSGDVNYNMFLVLKGLMRSHIVKTNGDDRTVFLATEGLFIGSPKTFIKGEPTNETITTLEDTWVGVYDIRSFEEVSDKNAKVQKFYLESLKKNFYEAVRRVEFHTVMSPTERYVHIQETHPEIIQRVPQIHLASYLGITPVSLSRIRARLAEAKK